MKKLLQMHREWEAGYPISHILASTAFLLAIMIGIIWFVDHVILDSPWVF